MKRFATQSLVCCLAWSVAALVPAQERPRVPLTNFQPSRDFLQVGNSTPGIRVPGSSTANVADGSCNGIAEMAIVYYADNPKKRLADVGATISQDRGSGADHFLRRITHLAEDQSASLWRAPAYATNAAQLTLDEMTRTHVPQRFYFSLENGKLHAVVAFDAEPTNNGISFRIGDPNYPSADNRRLIYDQQQNRWRLDPPGNYPARIRVGIPWDAATQSWRPIQRPQVYRDLIGLAQKKNETPASMRNQLQIQAVPPPGTTGGSPGGSSVPPAANKDRRQEEKSLDKEAAAIRGEEERLGRWRQDLLKQAADLKKLIQRHDDKPPDRSDPVAAEKYNTAGHGLNKEKAQVQAEFARFNAERRQFLERVERLKQPGNAMPKK